jgi:hypothetical protein
MCPAEHPAGRRIYELLIIGTTRLEHDGKEQRAKIQGHCSLLITLCSLLSALC